MNQHLNTSETNPLQEIHEALAAETPKLTQEDMELAERERRHISRIGDLLRYAGIGILLLGVGAFLFQRWGIVNHLERYLLFLGFTGTVCGAGLWCGLKVRENKGARTLLGFVVALIPVHCAQIGALLYSQFGSNFTNHPSFLRWDPGNMTNALVALAVGLIGMVPMAYLSYAVLARRYATPLCVLGFGVSSLLIAPTREPVAIVGFLLASTLAIFHAERRFLSISELSTREAITARAVPFIAMAMLVVRQYLYDPSSLFIGALFAFAAVGLLTTARFLSPNRWAIGSVETGAMVCAIVSGWYTTSGVLDLFHLWHSVFAPLIIGAPLAVGLVLMGFYTTVMTRSFHTSGATILLLTGLMELGHRDPSGSVIALLCGFIAIVWACIAEVRSLLYAGVTLSAISLLILVKLIVTGLSASFWWITLGIAGIFTIVGASYFERYFDQVRKTVITLRRQVAMWGQ